ncbi:hypothetical protein [Corynebacterium halotolerans]|uniref:hypothetical protein n=1 Tax=Corynebacterium halotolerans TaxID=225326 RepID=UPI003CF61E09
MLFAEIDRRLDLEEHPLRRTRLEQFLIEAVRGMPTLNVGQAVRVALQVFDLIDMDRCDNLTQVIQHAWRLPVHPASEWQMMGYRPMTTATPIILDTPREGPVLRENEPEPYYILREMIDAKGHTPVTRREPLHTARGTTAVDSAHSWERRRVMDPDSANVYASFHGEFPRHILAMLGNLWKIGAVATWSSELGNATSRQRVNPAGVTSHPKGPHLDRRDAWYHLDISSRLGRDGFAEICLCVASILSGYSPQVWHNPYVIPQQGPLRMVEIEAASYIVCGRLGAPRRRSSTEWYQAHAKSEEPLPEGFRWDLVLGAATQLEDLLRGDSAPVWTNTGAPLHGE